MRNITLEEMKNSYTANNIKTLVGKEINIKAWVHYTRENGDGVAYDQYLFALEDGTLYRTGSKSFANSYNRLRNLCISIGLDTVKAHVVEKSTSNGYTVIVLE